MAIQKEVNVKLAETQNDLQAEIAKLTEASTAAAAARIEDVVKKVNDDISKLRSEHASIVQAHVLAAEERQKHVLRLQGEILSLNQVVASSRRPRGLCVEDIPREILLEYLFNYMRSKAFEVTCLHFYVYFLAQGFSLLHERLHERDLTLNLRDMRLFDRERMRTDGRTLLRFSRPRRGRFTIYLPNDELPTSRSDLEIFLLPFYSSAN